MPVPQEIIAIPCSVLSNRTILQEITNEKQWRMMTMMMTIVMGWRQTLTGRTKQERILVLCPRQPGGWKVMHYEGHWHIHSSFLTGKSDSESSMPGLNHGRHVLSDYCIDGRVSGAFSSFYALCVGRGFLYLSRSTVFFLNNLFSILFSKSLQALVRSFSGFTILLPLVCRILAEKKKSELEFIKNMS